MEEILFLLLKRINGDDNTPTPALYSKNYICFTRNRDAFVLKTRENVAVPFRMYIIVRQARVNCIKYNDTSVYYPDYKLICYRVNNKREGLDVNKRLQLDVLRTKNVRHSRDYYLFMSLYLPDHTIYTIFEYIYFLIK